MIHLDVTDTVSKETLTTNLKSKYGGIEIIASNAAARISKDLPQP